MYNVATLAGNNKVMRTIYVVSLDYKDGGADELSPDLQSAQVQKDKYIRWLKENQRNGTVKTFTTEMSEDEWKDVVDDPAFFFDNLHSVRLKELSVEKVYFGRMKSKADLQKQIGRINLLYKDHRLYMKAQNLVLLYNHNMSETEENKDLHKQFMQVCNRNPQEADRILTVMHERQYPVSIYAAPIKKVMPQTLIYQNVEQGDWVNCTFCGNVMLLPHAADKCPECGMGGRLQWVDDTRPEIQKSGLTDRYPVDRKLMMKAVFTDDTLQSDFPDVWDKIQKGEKVYY